MKKSIITREICCRILQNKLKTSNFKLMKYEVNEINDKIGFLGEYLKLQLIIRNENKVEDHYFFVKVVPQTGFSDFVITSGSFENEKFMFEVVFDNMIDGAVVEDCVPSCFFLKTNEMIVFEDLNYLGFKVANKHEPFGLEEISILLKKLAKFHASSFLLEEKLSKHGLGEAFRIDQKFLGHIKETNYVKIDKHLGYEAVKSAVKGCLKMVDYFSSENVEITNNEFKRMITEFYDKIMYDQCRPSKKYRNVFCHGDLWANNIMLKYDDTKKLIDCRFVDFQNVRICPPAHDVLSLIYLTTNRELRQKYLPDLLLLYHNELSTILSQHNCKPNDIIPLQEFLTCCDEFKMFAINFAVTLFPIVSLRSEEMEKLLLDKKLCEQVMFIDRGPFICEVCDRDDRYKKLLGDAMIDLRELCENLKNNNVGT